MLVRRRRRGCCKAPSASSQPQPFDCIVWQSTWTMRDTIGAAFATSMKTNGIWATNFACIFSVDTYDYYAIALNQHLELCIMVDVGVVVVVSIASSAVGIEDALNRMFQQKLLPKWSFFSVNKHEASQTLPHSISLTWKESYMIPCGIASIGCLCAVAQCTGLPR